MNAHSPIDESQSTIRLSFRWILLFVLIIGGIAFLGGIAGSMYFRPSNQPLTPEQDQLVTTVQQVTLSPGTQAMSVIDKHQSSIFLLTKGESPNIQFVGTAFAVTNDGLLMTAPSVTTATAAYDSSGQRTEISKVGEDAMYGFVYYRVKDHVITPLDLAGTEPNVGASGITLSHNLNTLQPYAVPVQLARFILPPQNSPEGIQRFLSFPTKLSEQFVGAPILDESGKLMALVANPENGDSFSISQIQSSLARFTNNQREYNPFSRWGFHVTHTFAFIPQKNNAFAYAVTVQTVDQNSSAARAGLKTGDVIQSVNGEAVVWNDHFIDSLPTKGPFEIQILRGDLEQTLTISEVTSSPSTTP